MQNFNVLSNEACVCVRMHVCMHARADAHTFQTLYMCAGVCLERKPWWVRGGKNVRVRQR